MKFDLETMSFSTPTYRISQDCGVRENACLRNLLGHLLRWAGENAMCFSAILPLASVNISFVRKFRRISFILFYPMKVSIYATSIRP